jgi:hypothetical protein
MGTARGLAVSSSRGGYLGLLTGSRAACRSLYLLFVVDCCGDIGRGRVWLHQGDCRGRDTGGAAARHGRGLGADTVIDWWLAAPIFVQVLVLIGLGAGSTAAAGWLVDRWSCWHLRRQARDRL